MIAPGTAPSPPTVASQQLVATFPDYVDAQRLVDRMSDDGFPVEHTRIVGDGVRMVEQVTGRLTRERAAGTGAVSGAWFGLLIGLLIGLFVPGPAMLWLLLVGLLVGALWGAVYGVLAHLAGRGQRDFASVLTLQAERYDVYVDATHAARATHYRELP
jgi:uncharacterized membrane protein